jgi:hypothetical protein
MTGTNLDQERSEEEVKKKKKKKSPGKEMKCH